MGSLDQSGISAAVRGLDLADLARRRWYASKGDVPSSARLGHAFALAPDAALALVDLRVGEDDERYAIPFVLRDGRVREARDGDGAWRALAAAIATGRTIPALARASRSERDAGERGAGPVEAALVCRPSPAFTDAWGSPPETVASAEETPLGRDQSNTSIVLDDRLLLKGYRRIRPGLNPDLELTAFLSEEAGFSGVPRLAGWAEAVTRDGGVSTVAMLQAFVSGAQDLYEHTAEQLAALVGAPGSVSMEWATEVAADLGLLVAGLHAALAAPPAEAPDFATRAATHDELKTWRIDAQRQLHAALPAVAAMDPEAGAELRREAAAITARISRFEAVATTPLVMRIHADLHLGQILAADDGYRIIDFEGEPVRPIEDRRRLDSPLRDVASLLRSLDHVARSGRRRAELRAGGSIDRPGLDIEAWIERSRERFLEAYAGGLRSSGAAITLDLDLLDAFEVAKEAYELGYAAAVLPSWLWAPREGMRWLLARGETA